MIRPALLLVLVVASSSAQEKQAPPRTAAAFVPKGHGCEVQIDLARLRAMRLWSDLAGAPPLRKLQQGGEEALGLALGTIDRVHYYSRLSTGGEAQVDGIIVFEGAEDALVLPDKAWLETSELRGLPTLVDSRWGGSNPDLWCDVSPTLKVFTSRQLLDGLLGGSVEAGAGAPELVALPDDPKAPAQMRVLLGEREVDGMVRRAIGEGVPLPKALSVALQAVEKEDGAQFTIAATLRFGAAKDAEDFVAMVPSLGAGPATSVLGAVLAKVKAEARGNDAVLRGELGRGRDIADLLAPVAQRMLQARVDADEAIKLVVARRKVGLLFMAAEGYRMKHGRVPTVEMLVTRDAQGHAFFEEDPEDPWGNEYLIREMVRGGCEVVCLGPDGLEGTEDDIVEPRG